MTLGSGGSIVGSVSNAGAFTINGGGTFNISGTLTSGIGGIVTTLAGGTLRATATSTVTDNVTFAPGTTSTVSAAAGKILTFASGSLTFGGPGGGANVKFGSATDTGVVAFGFPASVIPFGQSTIEVVGGTLRANGPVTGLLVTGLIASTTVDTGATLDLNGTALAVKSLQGGGTVMTGGATLSLGGVTISGSSNFSGAITGTGALVVGVIGGDSAVLSGTNTYAGGTTINAGSALQLGNGGASGSILGNVLDNGILNFNRSDAVTFGGAISGSGAVNQIGSGTTVLTGASTYTGATTVNAGTLQVDGSIASSSLTSVNNGGTLAGSGTVGVTNINSGGTLAPGNSIAGASLEVSGNLAFQSGAFYLVQINQGATSFANVTGTASLGGATVAAVFANGSSISKQYTILSATGGVSGSFFPTATTNLPAFQTTLSYDAHHAFLNLSLNFAASGAINGNQQAVGNAVGNFFNSNASIPFAFGALTPAGLTQASGETATGSQQTTFDAMTQFLGLLLDPFIDGRGAAAAPSSGATPYAGEDPLAYAARGKKRTAAERDAYAMFTKAPLARNYDSRWSVWAAGFGGSQSTDGNAALGSNNTTSRVFGMAAGADYIFSPRTIAGFALAGGGTNFSVANGGSGRSDLFQAGAFVRHTVGAAYISGALAYGWQDITTDRIVTIAGVDRLHAEFNANAFSGRVEGGYRFVTPWMPGIGVTPYAAAQFTTFDLPAYAEQVLSGANTFALAYGSRSVTDTRSELGIRTDKSFAMQNAIATLRGRVAWAHDFNPDRSVAATFQALPGASFVVGGAAQASDSALTTASAEMKWINGWSAAATFEGEFSDVTRSYAGKGVVRYAW
jgi:autotransporter-associated beta strand protein